MFPDSAFAQQFQLGKTKCSYMINHGLATHFKELLLENIGESPPFAILFDESMNRIAQEEQIDVYGRLWNASTQNVTGTPSLCIGQMQKTLQMV